MNDSLPTFIPCNQKESISLDIGSLQMTDDELLSNQNNQLFDSALRHLVEIESGVEINSDENRMVGHYWLRAPELSPSKDLTNEIEGELEKLENFVSDCQNLGYKSILQIGIGGSILGAQFLYSTFSSSTSEISFYSIDNTDPDGIMRVLSSIPDLDDTLVIVVSKSGGTTETKNALMITKRYFEQKSLDFSSHAIAVTGDESALYKIALDEKWVATFKMWDWVGGRTSIWTSASLLSASLWGFDCKEFLDGAKEVDEIGRNVELVKNPAALLALSWLALAKEKNMVVLPYKDRLSFFSRYLQQLIMESLGKENDRDGSAVHQGLTVYGNKGSTDQHAFVQQLRDGKDDFFVLFVEVLKDFALHAPLSVDTTTFVSEVDDGIGVGDYLHAFYLGTRKAPVSYTHLTLPTKD